MRGADCAEHLKQTDVTQPVMFIFSYALAQLLMKWVLKPSALIGHSAGEYVAACLAGVMTLEEALELITLRGRLMHSMPPGAMLSVPLPEQELKPLLAEGVSVRGGERGVAVRRIGTHDGIDRLERQLAERGHACSRLHTSHAFHSAMMEPIMEPFRRKVSGMTLRAPAIPFISNVSGIWITAEEAVDPEYWVRHLRGTVRFADGLRELLRDGKAVFVEVGPGNALRAFVRRHPDKTARHAAVNLVRHPKEQARDDDYLLHQGGRLWLEGARPDWKSVPCGRASQADSIADLSVRTPPLLGRSAVRDRRTEAGAGAQAGVRFAPAGTAPVRQKEHGRRVLYVRCGNARCCRRRRDLSVQEASGSSSARGGVFPGWLPACGRLAAMSSSCIF